MTSLRDRVVVITGASSGFGRGTALKFAKSGASLVLAARRQSLLKDVAKQCQKKGARAVVVEADVSKQEDIDQIRDAAIKNFGRIDVWINDAGVGAVGRFDEVPFEQHEQVVKTDLIGTMYGSYVALREFRRQGRGTLINISSFAGKVAAPYLNSYSASKFGVRGLDMSIRQELEQEGEKNIHVCTVMPVSFDTPFFEHAANYSGKEVKPIPPVYDPDEVVNAIFKLAENPKPEVIVGSFGKIGAIQQRIAPRLTEKQMGRNAYKAQMEQEGVVRDSSGSVKRAVRHGTGVRGGWRHGGNIFNKVVGIGVPAAAAVGVAVWRKKRRGESPDVVRVA